MYKQIIIARKDLNMSAGKLAAQVAHGSTAFLTALIRDNICKVMHPDNGHSAYEAHLSIDTKIYDEWINGAYTKVVLEARNKNQLLKAKTIAEELGLKEGKDFFSCERYL